MARGNRVPFGRMETSSAAAGEAKAAMTDVLGERHIMIPAGAPWIA